MVMDGFTAIILCIINIIGFLSVFYSISYISSYTSENYFYALFCLMVAGMNGVVLSGDLFNIFVFLEISAISSYALVAFGVEKERAGGYFQIPGTGRTGIISDPVWNRIYLLENQNSEYCRYQGSFQGWL
ncbi:MAG: hypothetical protein MZV63_24270 [Marinilabiliales bacterium]|nr:hypothetical protein [Marinilabiliales bacterium]